MTGIGPAHPGDLPRLVQWLVGVGRWIGHRIRPDHQSIRPQHLRPSTGGMRKHYVYIAVAPARACPRPADDKATGRARRFVHSAFPGEFPDDPTVSDGDVVVFDDI